RIRAVSDRAAMAEVLVRAVAGREPAEPVTLDDPGGAPSLRRPRHLHPLAGGEDVAHGEPGAAGRRVLTRDPELAQDPERGGARMRNLPAQRLARLLGLRSTEAQLCGGVAVALGAARGHPRTGTRLDDRDRDEYALGRVDLGHPELAADQAGERR